MQGFVPRGVRLTQTEVAFVFGISQERVRQLERRALAKLRRNETMRRLFAEVTETEFARERSDDAPDYRR